MSSLRAIFELISPDGSLVPGEPVPSIAVLRRVHGYSRSTVGKGLRMLEAEGLLCRVRGLGYYVASESLAPLAERQLRRAKSPPGLG